jgi:hypothetical protein
VHTGADTSSRALIERRPHSMTDGESDATDRACAMRTVVTAALPTRSTTGYRFGLAPMEDGSHASGENRHSHTLLRPSDSAHESQGTRLRARGLSTPRRAPVDPFQSVHRAGGNLRACVVHVRTGVASAAGRYSASIRGRRRCHCHVCGIDGGLIGGVANGSLHVGSSGGCNT